MSETVSYQDRVIHLDNARYHGGHRTPQDIDLIVMHATAGESAMSSIEWLNRPQSDDPASYHYLIERDGTIYRMCPIDMVAWHAGDSAWPTPIPYPPGNGGHSVNHRSIGIAWANQNDGEPLTNDQIVSAHWLVRVFLAQLDRGPDCVVGHYEISPGRKTDPRPAIDLDAWRDMVSR